MTRHWNTHQRSPVTHQYLYLTQQLEDIHVVILHKDQGIGLGFSIAGGSDLENKAPTVSHTLRMFDLLDLDLLDLLNLDLLSLDLLSL